MNTNFKRVKVGNKAFFVRFLRQKDIFKCERTWGKEKIIKNSPPSV